MSINFHDPMNDKARSMIKEMFGEPIAQDDLVALFDQRLEMEQRQMTELANAAKQPVIVELNEIGDIKTMADGTKYHATPKGWKKVAP